MRLKMDQVNDILLSYMRSCMKEAWLERPENLATEPSSVMLSEPSHVSFEVMCLRKSILGLLREG